MAKRQRWGGQSVSARPRFSPGKFVHPFDDKKWVTGQAQVSGDLVFLSNQRMDKLVQKMLRHSREKILAENTEREERDSRWDALRGVQESWGAKADTPKEEENFSLLPAWAQIPYANTYGIRTIRKPRRV